MAIKGIKKDQENLMPQGDFDLPSTGPALRVVTQDGRNPTSQNIDIGSLRTGSYRADQVGDGAPDTVNPEIGKVGNGPTFK